MVNICSSFLFHHSNGHHTKMSFAPKEIMERLLRERRDMMIEEAIPRWQKKHSQAFEHVTSELWNKTWNLRTVLNLPYSETNATKVADFLFVSPLDISRAMCVIRQGVGDRECWLTARIFPYSNCTIKCFCDPHSSFFIEV